MLRSIMGLVLLLASSPALADMPTDPAQFASFADRVLFTKLAERPVAGAVLIAVKDGQVFHARTYGMADREAGLPVEIDHTMFPLASITKTFTATAVAQLMVEGRLGLDDPVQRHLSFPLKQAGERDVTVRDLLTHATGIPDRMIGSSAWGPGSLLPLKEYLSARQPTPVLPPGQVHSYSNFGTALASGVLEQVTGRDHAGLLRDKVLAPLGMENSRFNLPGAAPATDPAARPARTYEVGPGGVLVPAPTEYSLNIGAAGLQASASDMARYMMAYLAGAAGRDTALIPAAGIGELLRHQGGNPDIATSLGLVWQRQQVGETLVVGHSGGQRGLSTDLRLFPAQGFGYFLAITGDGGFLPWDFLTAFQNEYLPETVAAPVALPSAAADAAAIAGTYQDFRFTNPDPLLMLSMLSEFRLTAAADGVLTLSMPGLYGGTSHRFVETAPDRYSLLPDDESHRVGRILSVVRDGSGSVSTLHLDIAGYNLSALPLPWYRQSAIKLHLLLAGLAVALAALLYGIITAIRRPALRAGSVMLALSALGILAFPVWIGLVLAAASQWDLLYGMGYLGLRPAFLLPWLSALLLGVAALLGRFRSRGQGGFILLLGLYLGLLAANGQFVLSVP
ncbi:serine hydrolase domain-containing protein [Niveispirillum sp. KHB5.9]|uniref:serine hydrolase domain-containing protein n=1 Tax=Niveispirillum sp. KHB5.9 TaxID=3400269 RepID=UPI003A8C82F8